MSSVNASIIKKSIKGQIRFKSQYTSMKDVLDITIKGKVRTIIKTKDRLNEKKS